MNVAVKFWRDVENPRGIPGERPCEVIENIDIPPDETYIIMTKEEYQSVADETLPAYLIWSEANPEPQLE